MPTHTKAPASASIPSYSALIRRALPLWLLVMVVLVLYWAQLLQAHRDQLAQVEAQTRLRATQMASALSLQIGSLFNGVDYVSRTLANTYRDDQPEVFRQALDLAKKKAFPEGALVQIAVADAQGLVQFSSLQDKSDGKPVSIADREHFSVHAQKLVEGMYISHPVQGRVSKRWSIQFSRAIYHNQVFAGVVVLSISPDYISNFFREVFYQSGDVVMLLRDDGSYLARSQQQESVLGKAVQPPGSGFLIDPGQQRGEYLTKAPLDNVMRYYAWHRAASYPVVVNVGLNQDTALQAVQHALQLSLLRNGLGTLMILLGMSGISWLFFQKQRGMAQLQESEERLGLALQGGDLGSWDWDIPSDAISFSVRWAQMLGYQPDDLPHTLNGLQTLTHPDDWPRKLAALRNHLEGASVVFESEHRMLHRDGHWVWILAKGRVTHWSSAGAPLRAVGTHLDITARKQAEAARAELQARLSKLVAQVPGMVYQYRLRPDSTACFPYASVGIRAIYQLQPEDVRNNADPVFAVIHPDDLQRVMTSIRVSAVNLTPWQCEYRVRFANGVVRWLSGQANPEREADGGTLWHGYIHDITATYTVQQALRQSEERLRLTVSAVRDGLWEWDTRSGVIHWDNRCYDMLGYEPQAFPLTLMVWTEMLHPLDREHTLAKLDPVSMPREGARVECRLRTAQHDWRWVEIRGQLVQDASGQHVRMMGTYSDISQRVEQAHLRRALLDQSAAAIFLAAPDRTIRHANARAVEMFAKDGKTLRNLSFSQLHVDAQTYQAFGSYYDTLRRNGQVRLEHPLRDAHGQIRWFDTHGTLLDPDRPDADVIWTLIDTTERHQAETALAAERVRLTAIIDRFPAGVWVDDEDGHIVLINQNLCDLLEVNDVPTHLVGQVQRQLLSSLPESSRALFETDGRSRSDGYLAREIPANHGRTLEVDQQPITHDEQYFGRLWLVRDITGQKRREAILETLAATDALTRLPNRRAFIAHLEQYAQDLVRGTQQSGAVLMIDLDFFKRINDSYGHGVGDKVLQQTASVIRHTLRADDVAGRLGGEEFAVLLPGAPADHACEVAERLRAAIADVRVEVNEGLVHVTASIGVHAIADATLSSDDWLARADSALYRAKHEGRNRVVRDQ